MADWKLDGEFLCHERDAEGARQTLRLNAIMKKQ
jgi:hypothetical protein